MSDSRVAARPRLRIAVIATVLAQAISLACGVLTIPLFISAFGQTNFGLWSSLTGIASYLSLLNLGVAQTVASRASTRTPEHVWAAIRRGVLHFLRVTVALLPVIVAVGLTTPWAKLFKLGEGQEDLARWAAVAVGVTFLLELPFGVFRAALQGAGAVAHERLISVVATLLRLVLAWVLSLTKPQLWLGVVILSGLNILSNASCLIALLRVVPRERKALDQTVARDDGFNSASAHFFILQIAGAIVYGSDVVVVGLFKGAAEAAQIAVAYRLLTFGMMFSSLLSPALGPFLARAWAESDLRRARDLALEFGQVSTAIGVAAALGFGAAGSAFVGIWVGPEYFVGHATWLGYCAVMIVQGLVMVPHTFLSQAGLHTAYARWAALEAGIKLVAGVALLPVLGLVALPLATLGARTVTTLWVMLRDFSGALGERAGAWAARCLGPSLSASLVFAGVYGCALLAIRNIVRSSWASLASAALAGCAFALAFLFMGVSSQTRKRVLAGIGLRRE